MRLDVVAHRLDDSAAQSGLVRSALRRGDSVDIAAQMLVGGLGPDQRDLEAHLPFAGLVEEPARRDGEGRDRRSRAIARFIDRYGDAAIAIDRDVASRFPIRLPLTIVHNSVRQPAGSQKARSMMPRRIVGGEPA